MKKIFKRIQFLLIVIMVVVLASILILDVHKNSQKLQSGGQYIPLAEFRKTGRFKTMQQVVSFLLLYQEIKNVKTIRIINQEVYCDSRFLTKEGQEHLLKVVTDFSRFHFLKELKER